MSIDRRVQRISDELVAKGAAEMARRLARAVPSPPPEPDALDKDPDATVAKARGIYLRLLGMDPGDETGLVARSRRIAWEVEHEAERRRLVRDTAATRERLDRIRTKPPGRVREFAGTIWRGLPWVGPPELFYPDMQGEDALTRGEWLDWVHNHKQAGAESMIDHLASLIPSNDGESYAEWRERLRQRRAQWSRPIAEIVNQSLSARPRPAEPRSPVTTRTRKGPRGGKAPGRRARGARRAAAPR